MVFGWYLNLISIRPPVNCSYPNRDLLSFGVHPVIFHATCIGSRDLVRVRTKPFAYFLAVIYLICYLKKRDLVFDYASALSNAENFHKTRSYKHSRCYAKFG